MAWAEEQDWFGLEDLVQETTIPNSEQNEWIQRNGVSIKLKDMETSHIVNCVKAILDSRIVGRDAYLKSFLKELINRRVLQFNH